MWPFGVLWDIVSLVHILVRAGSLDEGKRILEGENDHLTARIEDIKEAFFSASIQQGKERKRDEDLLSSLSSWVTKGQELVQEARSVLGHANEACSEKKRKVGGESFSSSQTWAKLVVVYKLVKTLSAHEKEADMLLRCTSSDGRGPDRGNYYIPLRELFGKVASVAMEQLQAFLQSDKIGRIAIHGAQGIGKTFLMKHLHNCVVKWDERFDYVYWVTFPRQFSVERVQDAVAAAVKCNLGSDDDLDTRAETLSNTLGRRGNFVIFLDSVPEAYFSLDRIGIPVPAEGGKSKLVLTTRSVFVCEMLDCSGTVKLDNLSHEEACQLLMNEARISTGSASLPENICSKLARKCLGVPRKIVDVATCIRGIDDPREQRNALFELGSL